MGASISWCSLAAGCCLPVRWHPPPQVSSQGFPSMQFSLCVQISTFSKDSSQIGLEVHLIPVSSQLPQRPQPYFRIRLSAEVRAIRISFYLFGRKQFDSLYTWQSQCETEVNWKSTWNRIRSGVHPVQGVPTAFTMPACHKWLRCRRARAVPLNTSNICLPYSLHWWPCRQRRPSLRLFTFLGSKLSLSYIFHHSRTIYSESPVLTDNEIKMLL